MFIFNKVPLIFHRNYRILFSSFSTAANSIEKTNLNLIMRKLKMNVDKSKQLQKALIDSATGQSNASINQQKTRIQINKMAPLVSLYEQVNAVLKNISDLNQMKKQTKDAQQLKIIKDQISALELKQQQLKEEAIRQLIPPDIYDDVEQIVLEFRSGAGGSESCLFVEDFSNMIMGYCQGMGWRTQVLQAIKDSNINRGYRTFNMKVTGPDAYKIMKCQSGVHKVIRVPQTQSKGRIHSSTISMVVMPSVPFDFVVNDKDIKYEFMKSSGPGGQSVNKTESACRATHIPTGMSVMNQEDRSQDRNKKRATEILKQKLFQIQYKKNVEQQTKNRKSQIGTMDRSQKIRTYNYPQDRITDHRTGLTLFGMEQMMNGHYLEKFIAAYQQKMYQQKLQTLLQDLKQNNKQV